MIVSSLIHTAHNLGFIWMRSAPDGVRFDVTGMAVKGLRRLTYAQVVFIGIAPK